ncbi:ROK family protein [Anaerolinea sp.]|uniref:ROK family protein n=1 Tax=Anaerolinea sp. TaxID=1872519 RepID=UPI002ACE6E32|nr:ROK family protein [Anaerolinea sp.]
MTTALSLPEPLIKPPLDPGFRPAVSATHAFHQKVSGEGVPLAMALEREDGQVSRFETLIFPDNHPLAGQNFPHIERLLKFLLWQRGAHTVYIGGSPRLAQQLANTYGMNGKRHFDAQFLGEKVYEQPFRVIACSLEEVPLARETRKSLGRHLEGCRIGFDLGASDRKVSAVVNGVAVYSEEVIWEPRKHSDPEYHYREILTALKTAASKMPHVDAIGGSAAGIYIHNRPRVASLFRSVPQERYGEIHTLFERLQQEMGVPLEVINDGDVTALAGSMSIGENAVLGIALGSSEAAGYVDAQGAITGWLNELAFAPIDYSPSAPYEEWSGDQGCGATYLSQQCVFRLAPQVGIDLPLNIPDAERLAQAQKHLHEGHEGAVRIWQTMGVYLGYALAHYADFYEVKHVLILGRCTSGEGGNLLLEGVRTVWQAEFPHLLEQIQVHLPDEKIRRVGQSVAAASLPELRKENQA